MSLLKGTLRAISAAAWTADVQIAGSLGSYLTGIPLSVAIPEGELVAGRTVIVAVPDERNPGDVAVLAVISAPLTSRGQTFNDVFVDADLDVDGYIQHNALTASQLVKTDSSKRLVSSATVSLTSEVTGVLPIANGGTALSAAASNGQVLIGNGTGFTLATLTGTANRVTVTNGAGTITLSGPQDLHSGASPTFAGATLAGIIATAGRMYAANNDDNVGGFGKLVVSASSQASPYNGTFTITRNETGILVVLAIAGGNDHGGVSAWLIGGATNSVAVVMANSPGLHFTHAVALSGVGSTHTITVTVTESGGHTPNIDNIFAYWIKVTV